MSWARKPDGLWVAWAMALWCAAASADDAPAAPAAQRRSPITVIELPADGPRLPGGARERPHHALSFAADAPKHFLRSLGLDATDCATRLRMPSRIKSARESGARVEVTAQVGLACHF